MHKNSVIYVCAIATVISKTQFFFLLPGCSFRSYNLFSNGAQGQNVPSSLAAGTGFHCSYVLSVTQAISDFNQYLCTN